jgi:hypothetical protein
MNVDTPARLAPDEASHCSAVKTRRKENRRVDTVDQTVTAGSSSLSYDPTADQYVYVWKTDKSWTGCRQLQVKLNDGTTHWAMFKFTK